MRDNKRGTIEDRAAEEASRRRRVTEAQFESIADGIIVRRLHSDPRYRNAENAEAQVEAEEAVEREVLADLARKYEVTA